MIEIFLQSFVLIWLLLGSLLLLMMYFNYRYRKPFVFFMSTLLMLFTISYSIYRENIISFRSINGLPTEKVRYISHNITIEGNKRFIGLWAFNVKTKKDNLYRFPYNEDIEKTLNKARQQQKGGSSTLLSMIENPNIPGISSGAKMVGEIETVDNVVPKESKE